MTIRYSEHHLWTRPAEDGTYLVGITDYAQDMLGDVVFVETPAVGSKVESRQVCGFVESVKTASDLHAPLSGEVLAINETLKNAPEQLNDAPETTWIFRLKATQPADFSALMDASTYLNSL